MFEQFRADDPAARLRGAAAVPLAAFLFAQAYFTFYPFLTRVPASLFWSVDFVLLAGALIGLIRATRIAWRARGELGVRGTLWLVAAIVVSLVAFWQCSVLTFPWL